MDKKEHVTKLTKACELQKSILNALPSSIALINNVGEIIAVNESLKKFGNENNLKSTQQCIGDNYIEISNNATGKEAETGKKMAQGIKQVINKTIPSFQLEYPCDSLTKTRWFRADVTPIINEQSIGAVIMHTDITERKQKEITSKRNAQLLEESQSIAKLGGWDLDLISGELYWTAETYRIHDTSPEEFNPTVDAGVSYFLPESKRIITEALELAINKGEGYDLTLETFTTKGRKIDVRTTCEVTIVDGKPVRLTGIFQDITKQKLSEAALRNSEKKHRALTENIGDVIVLINKEGQTVYQSLSAKRITGYTLKDKKDKTVWEFVHPEDLAIARTIMQQAQLSPSVPQQACIRMRHKEGHYIWIEGTILNLLHDKNINGYIFNYRDITERKKTEEEIRKSEEKFKASFKASFNGFSLVNASNLEFIEINQSFENIFGYSSKEIIGKTSLELNLFINPEDRQRHIEELKTKGNAITKKIAARKKDGKIIIVSLSSHISQVNDQQYISNEIKDITQEIMAEEALINNKNILYEAQRIANIGSWELNLINKQLTWTDETFRIFEIDPQKFEVTYDSFLEIIHPDDKEMVNKAYIDSVQNKTNYNIDYRLLFADGRIKYVHEQCKTYYNSEGIPLRSVGIVQDITERKLSGLKMLQLSQAIEQSPVMVVITDSNGLIEYVNPKFTQTTGYTEAEVIGKNPRILKSGKTSKNEYSEMWKQITQGEKWQGELQNKKKNRELYWESAVIWALKNEKGEITNYMAIKEDITERKEAEELKEKIIADIVQRNNDLEQFSYIISHNLRAPVTNILGLTNLMSISDYEENEHKEMLDGLSISSKNLDQVIKDLNVILQKKREITAKKELIKFSDIVNDIKKSIITMIETEQVEIHTDFSEAENLFTLKSYLYSILYNLITNSIKYRQPSINPKIEIRSFKSENKTILIFKDNGIGIDLKKKGHEVFGLYKRFHTHTDGKGMGLYMVKTQIETLGGKIAIESEVNKGTEFKIEFKKEKKII